MSGPPDKPDVEGSVDEDSPLSPDGWMTTPLPQRRRMERDGRSWFDRVSEPVPMESGQKRDGEWINERSLALLILTCGIILVLLMGYRVWALR